jgi:Contractile injection system tape measure protein
LLEHPAILKYNVLKIFANLVAGKAQELQPHKPDLFKKENTINEIPQKIAAKIQTAQAAFLNYIKRLPAKDFIILKDIFQKGIFETDNEKNIVKKTLLKLPRESIQLLQFLATLPEQDLNQLLTGVVSSFSSADQRSNNPIPFYTDEEKQNIHIENAGLCLLALYLPGFFRHLGYMEKDQFKNKSFAIRAIYMLQHLTSGQNKSPEYLLQFNKLLCGFRIDDYITKSERLTKKESTEANDLLESVIRNWKALKNTSPNGLRESFLKRKGILFESESKWTLQVERKGYDVLLNTIPWGFNMIKFPWMKKFIQVEW